MRETVSPRLAPLSAGREIILVLVASLAAAAPFSVEANAQTWGFALEPMTSNALSYLPRREATDEQGALTADHLKRTVVAFDTREMPGTIVIDTGNTHLYYVLGQGRAIRYGVGVGRDGFTWSGIQTVSRKAEWPDWIPPAEMIARQPYLPRWIGGGPGNPLGARAMYLGSSVFRIHGTNDPATIGQFVSSGCIRMTNEDVIELFGKVNIGTKVVVLPKARKLNLDAYASLPARTISVTVNRQLPPPRGVVSGIH